MRLPQLSSTRLQPVWHWLLNHPRALLNLCLGLFGILLLAGIFVYQIVRPIDVLQDWSVKTTKQVYAPGSTLEFVSTSVKLVSAEGTASRIFDCDAAGEQSAREIQLDKLTANRAPGYNAPRENSIQVPGVTAFNGLPRTCRIVFNVCYDNVILWRDHCETASSNDFHVKEDELDAESVRQQIDELTERIRQLEGQLSAYENSASIDHQVVSVDGTQRNSVVTASPSQTQPSQTPSPQPQSPSPSPSPAPAATPRPCVIGLLGLCILGAR